jgi:hypothetical protein
MKDMKWCRRRKIQELEKELESKTIDLDNGLRELQAAKDEAMQLRSSTARLIAAEKRHEAAQRQCFEAQRQYFEARLRARETTPNTPVAMSLREALDLADLYAAEIEEALAKTGMPAKLGDDERYGLLRIFAAGYTEFAVRVVKGQTPAAWRARRGRTPDEASAPMIYRGRNGFAIADTSWRFDADKTIDNALDNV